MSEKNPNQVTDHSGLQSDEGKIDQDSDEGAESSSQSVQSVVSAPVSKIARPSYSHGLSQVPCSSQGSPIIESQGCASISATPSHIDPKSQLQLRPAKENNFQFNASQSSESSSDSEHNSVRNESSDVESMSSADVEVISQSNSRTRFLSDYALDYLQRVPENETGARDFAGKQSTDMPRSEIASRFARSRSATKLQRVENASSPDNSSFNKLSYFTFINMDKQSKQSDELHNKYRLKNVFKTDLRKTKIPTKIPLRHVVSDMESIFKAADDQFNSLDVEISPKVSSKLRKCDVDEPDSYHSDIDHGRVRTHTLEVIKETSNETFPKEELPGLYDDQFNSLGVVFSPPVCTSCQNMNVSNIFEYYNSSTGRNQLHTLDVIKETSNETFPKDELSEGAEIAAEYEETDTIQQIQKASGKLDLLTENRTTKLEYTLDLIEEGLQDELETYSKVKENINETPSNEVKGVTEPGVSILQENQQDSEESRTKQNEHDERKCSEREDYKTSETMEKYTPDIMLCKSEVCESISVINATNSTSDSIVRIDLAKKALMKFAEKRNKESKAQIEKPVIPTLESTEPVVNNAVNSNLSEKHGSNVCKYSVGEKSAESTKEMEFSNICLLPSIHIFSDLESCYNDPTRQPSQNLEEETIKNFKCGTTIQLIEKPEGLFQNVINNMSLLQASDYSESSSSEKCAVRNISAQQYTVYIALQNEEGENMPLQGEISEKSNSSFANRGQSDSLGEEQGVKTSVHEEPNTGLLHRNEAIGTTVDENGTHPKLRKTIEDKMKCPLINVSKPPQNSKKFTSPSLSPRQINAQTKLQNPSSKFFKTTNQKIQRELNQKNTIPFQPQKSYKRKVTGSQLKLGSSEKECKQSSKSIYSCIPDKTNKSTQQQSVKLRKGSSEMYMQNIIDTQKKRNSSKKFISSMKSWFTANSSATFLSDNAAKTKVAMKRKQMSMRNLAVKKSTNRLRGGENVRVAQLRGSRTLAAFGETVRGIKSAPTNSLKRNIKSNSINASSHKCKATGTTIKDDNFPLKQQAAPRVFCMTRNGGGSFRKATAPVKKVETKNKNKAYKLIERDPSVLLCSLNLIKDKTQRQRTEEQLREKINKSHSLTPNLIKQSLDFVRPENWKVGNTSKYSHLSTSSDINKKYSMIPSTKSKNLTTQNIVEISRLKQQPVSKQNIDLLDKITKQMISKERLTKERNSASKRKVREYLAKKSEVNDYDHIFIPNKTSSKERDKTGERASILTYKKPKRRALSNKSIELRVHSPANSFISVTESNLGRICSRSNIDWHQRKNARLESEIFTFPFKHNLEQDGILVKEAIAKDVLENVFKNLNDYLNALVADSSSEASLKTCPALYFTHTFQTENTSDEDLRMDVTEGFNEEDDVGESGDDELPAKEKQFQQVKRRIDKEPLVSDIKWSLLMAAAHGYNFDKYLTPFPEHFMHDGRKDINALLEVTEEITSLSLLRNMSAHEISSSALKLLHWLLVELANVKVVATSTREVEPSLQKRPVAVFSVWQQPATLLDRRLRSNGRGLPKVEAFCCARLDKFHALLHGGMVPSGVMNRRLDQALTVAKPGYGSGCSILGSRLTCVARCQVLFHPRLVKVAEEAVTVRGRNLVRMQQLLVFREPDDLAEETPWIWRHLVKLTLVVLALHIAAFLVLWAITAEDEVEEKRVRNAPDYRDAFPWLY